MPILNISLPSELFKTIIQTTSFAISNDELKPALTGVLFQFKDGGLTTVATDGHRLSRYHIKEFESSDFNGDIIIPRKFF